MLLSSSEWQPTGNRLETAAESHRFRAGRCGQRRRSFRGSSSAHEALDRTRRRGLRSFTPRGWRMVVVSRARRGVGAFGRGVAFRERHRKSGRRVLSDGLTEDIINRLAQSPELRVLARTSVFRYKNKDEDLQKIGKELQVPGVLTGRITRRGDEVAVETDLVHVSDGTQIWGQRYTRKISDVAALQNEIVSDLSARLTQVTHREKEPMTTGTTANSEAYQLYLKGRFYWNQRTKENLRRSIDWFPAGHFP
jgi:TolB-like protein